jgi:hypothetical protein
VRVANAIVADVSGALAGNGTAASVSTGACSFTPVEISIAGSGTAQRLRSIHAGANPALWSHSR